MALFLNEKKMHIKYNRMFYLIVKTIQYIRNRQTLLKKLLASTNFYQLLSLSLFTLLSFPILQLVILLFTGAILLFFFRSPQILQGWGDAIQTYYNLDDNKL